MGSEEVKTEQGLARRNQSIPRGVLSQEKYEIVGFRLDFGGNKEFNLLNGGLEAVGSTDREIRNSHRLGYCDP